MTSKKDELEAVATGSFSFTDHPSRLALGIYKLKIFNEHFSTSHQDGNKPLNVQYAHSFLHFVAD
ncbi:hypothetical protein BT96DRAFT_925880 [Gymnopus androsaceus JB14]|uniref:Uncharacterized protein n=1 Tax=Gymnopus androsaceus JB14 TaxID=1447944 RepID=A0A6A4GYA9_9AGAR|nr:hypothetical protein BT96DRAFT_925880 [Gymnopus androsaceus JB14]